MMPSQPGGCKSLMNALPALLEKTYPTLYLVTGFSISPDVKNFFTYSFPRKNMSVFPPLIFFYNWFKPNSNFYWLQIHLFFYLQLGIIINLLNYTIMKDFTMNPVTSGSNDCSWYRRWKSLGTFLGLFLALTLFTFNQSIYAQINIPGTAPVQNPNGGFGVDGDARANYPVADIGDWFAYPGGDGGSVFPAGYELPSANFEGVIDFQDEGMTFFFRDDITNNDPTIFTGSNKINHDPETYEWGAGSSPNKNEIQTAIVHFSYGDPALGGDANDLWVMFAADREVTNGSSYIDFEFLQSALTKTGTLSGSFLSDGEDGGRTEGDILVTLEFTQGGDAATVVIRRWEPDGSGGFVYNVFTDYPVGTIFGTNNIVETIVPWPIYNTDPIEGGPNDGYYQYEINQWAEGAVNLSALFDQDECFNISTLFVRTRTSGSSGQSELKDFPEGPVQLELNLYPDISFTDPDPVCSPATVDLTAIVVEGCDNGTLSYWLDEDATMPISMEDAATMGAGTYYIKCASNINPICVDIAPVTVVVNPLPTATANNGGPVCYDEESVSLSETGGDAVSWMWSSDGAALFSDATAQNPTVSGFVDGEIFTVEVTDANGCVSSDTTTLTVYPEPTATADNSGPVCYDATSVTLYETGGDAVSWTWSSDGAAVFSDINAQNPTVTGFVDGEIFTVDIIDGNDCTSSDSTTLSVYMEPTATAGNSGPVCYDAESVTLYETGGDAVSWMWSSDGDAVFSDATVQNPTVTGYADGEIFTVNITDANDCTSSDTTTLIVYPEPSCTASNSGPVCAGDDVMLYESGGDAVSWLWSSDGGATFNDNTLQNPTASGAVDGEIFTVIITDINDCTSTCTTTVTVEICMQEGCTLGYWKNHTDQWCDEYLTCDTYGAIFMNAPSELASLSLLDVLNLGGGGVYNLGRQSVAALLNACSIDVQYHFSTSQQVIDYVNAAFLAGDYQISQAGSELDMYNQAGCPLGGSSATTAPSDDCPQVGVSSTEALAGINVSPVPFRESLNVQYDFDYVSDAVIQMYDMQGRLLSTQKEANASKGKITNLSINFRTLPSQVYVIKVTTDRDVFTKKIVSDK